MTTHGHLSCRRRRPAAPRGADAGAPHGPSGQDRAHGGRDRRRDAPRPVERVDAPRQAEGRGAGARPARGGVDFLRPQRGRHAGPGAARVGARPRRGARFAHRSTTRSGRRRWCARAERAAGWPDAVAGEMERHWSPGRNWESLARAVAGLVRLGDVVDIGSGDGSVAQLLGARAKSWTCVDRSERVLDGGADAARQGEERALRPR